jgi:hypothetical protein
MRALNELKAEHNDWLIRSVYTRSTEKEFNSRDADLFMKALKVPHNPAWGSVRRDVDDVFNLGHWFLDSAQKHHFMRRYDGQSPFHAYLDAVRWIEKNATMATRMVARTAARYKSGHRYVNPFYGLPSTYMGNAVHALQDSFSKSHVSRELGTGGTPGRITHIKLYEGREKKGHSHADDLWRKGTKNEFSVNGRYAINATKELIWMVISTARKAADTGGDVGLLGWTAFRRKWLAISPKLSAERNFAYDFINRFRSGGSAGQAMVTVNMDEEGLARALVEECGGNTGQVQEVFERLYEKHGSDVDDVAELYVNRVRKTGGEALRGLKTNYELARLLIKAMDEGWTSEGEQDCIAYLTNLVNPAMGYFRR